MTSDVHSFALEKFRVWVFKLFSFIQLKLSAASILAFLELLIGDLANPMTIAIIVLLILDVITGLIFAVLSKSFTSKRMFYGCIIKVGVYGFIILVLMIMAHQATHFSTKIISVLFSSFAYSMIGLTELSSLGENIYKISEICELENLSWLRWFVKFIKKLMDRMMKNVCNDKIIDEVINKKEDIDK